VRVYNYALSADEIYGIYRTSSPVCSNPSDYEGNVMYNAGTNHVVQFCDNASWRPLGPVPGAGGSGCTNPVHPEGDMIYNDTAKGSGWMQYCDGTNWVQIGGPNLPTSGLVGYWNLDEGSGTTAADSSGNGNTGTLQNSPAWTTSGKDAGALTFNGSNQYVNIPSSASLQFSGAFTASVWLKTTGLNSSAQSMIIGNEAWPNTGWEMLDNGQYGAVIMFRVLPSTASTNFPRSLVNDGVWHNIVGVDDGTNIELYLDGILMNTYPASTFTNNAAALNIGDENGGGGYFPGTIDDARIFNRALSAQEIWQLYNGT
jgi:hypothetical protein